MDTTSRFLLAAAAAATLATVGVAQAADKSRAAASAPRSKDSILTQNQLRECMAQKEKVDQRNAAAVRGKADIVALKAELDRSGAENAAAQAGLDRTKKDDVDAFNARVVARNAMVDDYQAKADAYNKDVEDVHALQDAYSSSCGNRRYDDRDLADIQRSKK